jgi:hypothetical protein
MFFAFVVIIVAAVLLPEELIGGRLYDYMVAAILIVALVETTRTRRNAIIALVVGLPAIGARLVAANTPDSVSTNSPAVVLSMLFFAFLIWNLVRDLLVGERDTSERVFGALTAYLCMGILFALLYAHIQYLNPESFKIADHLITEATSQESLMMPVFTYFSFVTLTTLGYGDVTPITEQARTIAWFEAFIGQIYLAVMVGGLVGVFFAEAAQQASRALFGRDRDRADGAAADGTDTGDETHGGGQ